MSDAEWRRHGKPYLIFVEIAGYAMGLIVG
jgi:hypothetical protein